MWNEIINYSEILKTPLEKIIFKINFMSINSRASYALHFLNCWMLMFEVDFLFNNNKLKMLNLTFAQLY